MKGNYKYREKWKEIINTKKVKGNDKYRGKWKEMTNIEKRKEIINVEKWEKDKWERERK